MTPRAALEPGPWSSFGQVAVADGGKPWRSGGRYLMHPTGEVSHIEPSPWPVRGAASQDNTSLRAPAQRDSGGAYGFA
jgi:hypothetical protein